MLPGFTSSSVLRVQYEIKDATVGGWGCSEGAQNCDLIIKREMIDLKETAMAFSARGLIVSKLKSRT
jgi:hypothetical protein